MLNIILEIAVSIVMIIFIALDVGFAFLFDLFTLVGILE